MADGLPWPSRFIPLPRFRPSTHIFFFFFRCASSTLSWPTCLPCRTSTPSPRGRPKCELLALCVLEVAPGGLAVAVAGCRCFVVQLLSPACATPTLSFRPPFSSVPPVEESDRDGDVYVLGAYFLVHIHNVTKTTTYIHTYIRTVSCLYSERPDVCGALFFRVGTDGDNSFSKGVGGVSNDRRPPATGGESLDTPVLSTP